MNNEQLLPNELWQIILSHLNRLDQLIFLFTAVGQEKSIRMDTSAICFMDHNQEPQALSIPESRRVILDVLQGYYKRMDMDSFYRGDLCCCDPNNFIVTITYGYERTFTLYPKKFRIPCSVVYLHDLIREALLDETNTSYEKSTKFESPYGIIVRAACRECGQEFRSERSLEDVPPECSVCEDTLYPCLKCSCDRWYCNEHKYFDPYMYGLCVGCEKMVCSRCGYLCHEGNCAHPVCESCSTVVDCCDDDSARLCSRYHSSLRHPMCGNTMSYTDDDL